MGELVLYQAMALRVNHLSGRPGVSGGATVFHGSWSPSMTIWKLALASRSRALLPRMGPSKGLIHSSTALLLVMIKLEGL